MVEVISFAGRNHLVEFVREYDNMYVDDAYTQYPNEYCFQVYRDPLKGQYGGAYEYRIIMILK
jgi:hypothetical protein